MFATKRVLFGSLLMLLALPLACAAWQPGPGDVTMEIVDDHGWVLRQFEVTGAHERGIRRAYLEAVKGRRYGIRVRNHTARRIGLVVAVDGRNIISGAKSNLDRGEPMYVLNPYQSATYDGWRTSDTRVHRFFFTESSSSYAEAFDDHTAMGVIALAGFAEEAPPPREQRLLEQRRREGAAPPAAGKSAPSAPADAAESQPGTGFGEGRRSPVVRVHFVPQKRPFTKQFIKYEWLETLVKLGFLHEPPGNRFWPWPPVSASVQGYAPYPPGYRDHH